MRSHKKSVLFVCLGNTCRSPMAEAVFQNLLKTKDVEDKWVVDSAALKPWHVGSQPNQKTLSVLKKNGIANFTHTARQISIADFEAHDFILGMDNMNIHYLRMMAPEDCKAKISLLGAYDPQEELIIEDPYFDDCDEGFLKCYEQCVRSCTAFLEK